MLRGAMAGAALLLGGGRAVGALLPAARVSGERVGSRSKTRTEQHSAPRLPPGLRARARGGRASRAAAGAPAPGSPSAEAPANPRRLRGTCLDGQPGASKGPCEAAQGGGWSAVGTGRIRSGGWVCAHQMGTSALGSREAVPTDTLGEGKPLHTDKPWPWAGPRGWPHTASGRIPSSAAAGPLTPASPSIHRRPPSFATRALSPRGSRIQAQNQEGGGQAGVAPSPQPSWPHLVPHPRPATAASAPSRPAGRRGSKLAGGHWRGQGWAVKKQQTRRLQPVRSGRSGPAGGGPCWQEASSGATVASPPHCSRGVHTPGGSGWTWPSPCGPRHSGDGQGFLRAQDGRVGGGPIALHTQLGAQASADGKGAPPGPHSARHLWPGCCAASCRHTARADQAQDHPPTPGTHWVTSIGRFLGGPG